MNRIALILLSLLTAFPVAASAAPCAPEDKPCLMAEIESLAPQIQNALWRDQIYRELAKSYAYEGIENKAVSLIAKISNTDTKAMTIRGIGFAAADTKMEAGRIATLFKSLSTAAKKIDYPPSRDIAWTYIAMAQALAKDDTGALTTIKEMENPALKHKALAETAEIQAERGDAAAALATAGEIDSLSFRNKALSLLNDIFVEKNMPADAYHATSMIDNPYMRARALQTIIRQGNAEEETPKGRKADD